MSEEKKSRRRRKRINRELYPVIKFVGSLVMVGILVYLSTFAIRYCLGLFADGDYVLSVPGQVTPQEQEQQPQETIPENTEPTAVMEIGRANILAAGDLMMHMPIVRSGKTGDGYTYNYIFSYIQPYASDAHYAVVNLETTLSGTSGKEYTGYPKFNSPDEVAGGAASGGFDMMLIANNHSNDYGTSGMLRTLETVRAAGLDTLGVTQTADEQKYAVKELGGVKVGMINYTFGDIGEDRNRPALNGLPTDKAASGLVNAFDYDKLDLFYEEMENHISAMRASGAEAIVLFIHWGDEYTTKVNEKQTAIAQKMCDMGVDVIAGSHPHVVQTVDLLTSTTDENHKTVCLYSMGNFLSNQRSTNISLTTGQSEDSAVFSFSFVKYSNGEVRLDNVRILPTWVLIRGTGDARTYHILPLDTQVEDWAQAYDLSSSQLEDAKTSYNRTMAIIGIGIKELESELEAWKTAWQESHNVQVGVG